MYAKNNNNLSYCVCVCRSQALFPESNWIFLLLILAGFLTCSSFVRPSHIAWGETVVCEYCTRILIELTAAGLFRILTWFPFHYIASKYIETCSTKISATKVSIKFITKNEFNFYIIPTIFINYMQHIIDRSFYCFQLFYFNQLFANCYYISTNFK